MYYTSVSKNTTSRNTTESPIMARAREVVKSGYSDAEVARMKPQEILAVFERVTMIASESFLRSQDGLSPGLGE